MLKKEHKILVVVSPEPAERKRLLSRLAVRPLFRKYFGYLAPISAAGIGSSDISLAAIARCKKAPGGKTTP